jgi:hypothetical protein
MKFANAVEFWGPCAWKFLHSVAATYDPTTAQIGMDSLVEYKRPYITFFGSIGDILPCKLCRQHFKSYAATNPLGESMGSTETMQRWVYNAHNQVNVSNNKISPPFHEVQRRYGELEQTKPGGGLHTRESRKSFFWCRRTCNSHRFIPKMGQNHFVRGWCHGRMWCWRIFRSSHDHEADA